MICENIFNNFQGDLHYWFKSYGNFAEWMNFAYWWSFIGKDLRRQPAQHACSMEFRYNTIGYKLQMMWN